MANTDLVAAESSDPPQRIAPADLVDVASLDPARRQKVASIAQSVTARDSNAIATFGSGPQRKLSGFLDQLLAGTRAEEVGLAGELVTELATDIKALDLPAVKREVDGQAPVLARLPVVGKYYSALRRFRAMQKTVVEHLATIEQKAETHLGKLKASNAGLDRLLDATEDNLRELEAWIEIQNTLDTILFDLPDLKSAIVRVAALHQISRAGDATAARRKIGQELQQIGIDALDQAYTKAKQTQGDMGADVELLSRMGDKILATLDKGLEIDRENRVKREQAVQQLGEVRLRLMDGLRGQAEQARQPQGTPFR